MRRARGPRRGLDLDEPWDGAERNERSRGGRTSAETEVRWHLEAHRGRTPRVALVDDRTVVGGSRRPGFTLR